MLQQTPESSAMANRRPGMGASKDKFGSIMDEYASGNLKSGAGNIVTNPRQANAIANSVERKQGALSRAVRS